MSVKPKFDQVTICPLCTDVMKEPRILPCFHSYCLSCLQNLNCLQGPIISCLVCNFKFTIPTDGVQNLPRNSFIQKMNSAEYNANERSNETKECVICKVSDITSEASRYCQNCEQALCKCCANKHSKTTFSSHHLLTDLSEIARDKSVNKKISKLCPKHSDKYLDLYCKLCNSLICSSCYTEKHNQHDVTIFENPSKQLEKQLNTNIITIKEKILKYELQLKLLEDQEHDCFIEANQISEEIIFKSEELIKIVEKYKNTLIKKVNSFKEKEIKKNADLTAIINDKIKSLSTLVSRNEGLINQCYEPNYKKGVYDYTASAYNLIGDKVEDLAIKDNFLNYIFCDLFRSADQYIDHILGKVVETNTKQSLVLNKGCANSFKLNVHKHISQNVEFKDVNIFSRFFLKAKTEKLDIDNLSAKIILKRKIPRKAFCVKRSENFLFFIFQNSNDVEIYDIDTMSIKNVINVLGLNNPSNLIVIDSFLLISEKEDYNLHFINWRALEFSRWKCCINRIQNMFALLNGNVMIIGSLFLRKMAEYNIKGSNVRNIVIPEHIESIYKVGVFDEGRLLISYTSINKSHKSNEPNEKLHKISIINTKGEMLTSFVTNENFIRNSKITSLMIDDTAYCLICNLDEMRFYTMSDEFKTLKELKNLTDEQTRIQLKSIGNFEYLDTVINCKDGIYLELPRIQYIFKMQISN